MNVAALVTNNADGGFVGPIQIEERRGCGIQLAFAPPKRIVAADQASQRFAVNLKDFRLFSRE